MKSYYYVIGMQHKFGWAITYYSESWDIGYLTLLQMGEAWIIHSKN